MNSLTGLRTDRMRAALARAAGWLRPSCQALIAPHAVVLQATGKARALVRLRPDPVGNPQEQLASAVADLLQMIDQSNLHGRRWRVVISDFWARPLLVPCSAPLPADRDVDLMLESQFRRSYGDLMEGWRWCWARQGDQLVAVAWPSLGLVMLRDGIAARAGILASAKPLAVDIGAMISGQSESSWLAIMESRSVSLIRRQSGVWQEWRVMPADSNVADALLLQLEREAARRRDECRTLCMVDLRSAPDSQRIRQALVDAGWRVHSSQPIEADKSLSSRLSLAIGPGAA